MRISSHIARLMLGAVSAALVLGLCLASVPDRARNLIDRVFGTAPAFAFDGTTTPSTTNALTALQYAAEQGQPVAQWKLGRMYADGDGVPRDDLRAFSYFSQVAN